MSRGRPKRSIRDLSRDHATHEEVDDVIGYLKDAPDIAYAVLFASQLEMLLEQAIFEKLQRRDQETINLLSEPGGPVSGMYAKVSLAYAMGIIDDTTRRNFNVARNIRNAFAHAKRRISFDEPEMLDELRAIRAPARVSKDERESIVTAQDKSWSGRVRFSSLCTALFIRLAKRKRAQLQVKLTKLKKKMARRLTERKSLPETHE